MVPAPILEPTPAQRAVQQSSAASFDNHLQRAAEQPVQADPPPVNKPIRKGNEESRQQSDQRSSASAQVQDQGKPTPTDNKPADANSSAAGSQQTDAKAKGGGKPVDGQKESGKEQDPEQGLAIDAPRQLAPIAIVKMSDKATKLEPAPKAAQTAKKTEKQSAAGAKKSISVVAKDPTAVVTKPGQAAENAGSAEAAGQALDAALSDPSPSSVTTLSTVTPIAAPAASKPDKTAKKPAIAPDQAKNIDAASAAALEKTPEPADKKADRAPAKPASKGISSKSTEAIADAKAALDASNQQQASTVQAAVVQAAAAQAPAAAEDDLSAILDKRPSEAAAAVAPAAHAADSAQPPSQPASNAQSAAPAGSPAANNKNAARVAGASGVSDVDRARFVQRVARAFQSVGDQGGSLRLRLNPPELGAVKLDLSVRDGVMSARLEAETPAARSMLLENLPALKERLAEHNIKVDHFQVDLFGQSAGGLPDRPAENGDRRQNNPAAPPRGKSGPQGVEVSAPAPVATRGQGGQLNVVI